MITLFALIAIATVGQQPADLVARQTEYFAIDLPRQWKLDPVAPDDKESEIREFRLADETSKEVFTVSVAIDGPRFIQCFCAPWSQYKRYRKNGLMYADLPSEGGRTLKAVGKRFSTDVHLRFEGFEPALLNRIVESIRPR